MLSSDDPSPVMLINAGGRSPFLLTGDHAGNCIPPALGGLGLASVDQQRHIAWDIGIAGLGAHLAERLDALFVAQRYSRLVIDCNRDPASEEAVPAVSDGTMIAGNQLLSSTDRTRRVTDVHAPYHAALSGLISERLDEDEPIVVVALHSFTPSMAGVDRPWHIGVLHWGGDDRFALALLKTLQSHAGLIVGDNEPYRMDATDYTVPRHAISPGLPYAEIEIRQDLIAEPEGHVIWGNLLTEALVQAFDELSSPPGG